jgi:hypothetical protein
MRNFVQSTRNDSHMYANIKYDGMHRFFVINSCKVCMIEILYNVLLRE